MHSKHAAVAAALALTVVLGAAGCATTSGPAASSAPTKPAPGVASASSAAAPTEPYLSKAASKLPRAAAGKLGSLTVRVSDRTPAQNSNVTVSAQCANTNAKRIGGLKVKFVWRFKERTAVYYATTNAGGFANCTKNIGPAAKGYRVVVEASAVSGRVPKSASTFFITK